MFKCFKKDSGSDKRMPRVMYPQAVWNEELPLLKTVADFKFDEDHFFVVHFTAGRQEQKAEDFIKSFLKRGLCTYYIDDNGLVWQQHDGDRSGWHIGANEWQGENIRRRTTGVEIANSGKLHLESGSFVTWYGEVIPEEEVRYVADDERLVEGYYRKYLPVQEQALAELLAWHVSKGLPMRNILGHDEVAAPRGRKNDPGGSLSLDLGDFKESRVRPLIMEG